MAALGDKRFMRIGVWRDLPHFAPGSFCPKPG